MDHSHHHHDTASPRMAASATLHCLTGCALGEIAGLVLGTAIGLSNFSTLILAVGLAFLFGYTLSSFPLLKAGLSFGAAVKLVLIADTLSILTMEVVDNSVMALVPGAMGAGLANTTFWLSMGLALTIAYAAAYPVNLILLRRGKGHALVHEYHHGHSEPQGWRARLYVPASSTLVAFLVGLLLAGVVVSVESGSEGSGKTSMSAQP